MLSLTTQTTYFYNYYVVLDLREDQMQTGNSERHKACLRYILVTILSLKCNILATWRGLYTHVLFQDSL